MKLGIDLIDKHLDYFKGKRVGLITNPTGINSEFKSTIDILKEKTNLVALFSPEHGVRGNLQAGVQLDTYIDEKTNVTVYSMYGASKRPSKEALDTLDILCIDLQDAGSRFYTFIYSMAYAMIACAEENKEFVVFDRPNPACASIVEGNILDLSCRSFIGYYPIVQRHGMTMSELAKMFNVEYNIGVKLKTIDMEGYKREMYFEDTKKLWIMPSPNLPTPDLTIIYNTTCIFEGTNMSEGRGTTVPFKFVGSPYVNEEEWARVLNDLKLPGVYFRPMVFTPVEYNKKYSKHAFEMCRGVDVCITNRDIFQAVKTGFAMLDTVRKLYPNDFKVNLPYKEGMKCMLELNTGCTYIKDMVYSLEEQFRIIDEDTEKFKRVREKYLIY